MSEREQALLARIEARRSAGRKKREETDDDILKRIGERKEAREREQTLKQRSWLQLNPDRMI